jgi:uncharacterized protein (DUF1919 family)
MKFVIMQDEKHMMTTLEKLMTFQTIYPKASLSDIVLKFAEIHSMLEENYPTNTAAWYDEQAFIRLGTYYKARAQNGSNK